MNSREPTFQIRTKEEEMFEAHGFSDLDTAKKCFAENLRMFGSPQGDPEKYNLYNGLAKLAMALEKMEAEISLINTRLNQITRT